MAQQTTGWHFDPYGRRSTFRDSNAREFFEGSESADALVREAIQNSLDASDDDEVTDTEVHFTFRTVSAETVGLYSNVIDRHVAAEGNGLTNKPDFEGPCRVLLVEDFGTTGLTGDALAAGRPRDDAKNHFWHFFRAEAITDKDPSNFGQRGVGKDVFVTASRVRAIFGLTMREWDETNVPKEATTPLLFGKCILKSHYVDGSDDMFQDGFYGVDASDDRAIKPVTDADRVRSFAEDFGVSERRLDRGQYSQAGLSVVVPYADDELTFEGILHSVVTQYFYPVLRNRLKVTVRDLTDPSAPREHVLNEESVWTALDDLTEDEAAELRPLMELARWSRSLDDDDRLMISEPKPGSWQWQADLVSEDTLLAIRTKLDAGERAAVRFPVTVRAKVKGGAIEDRPTFFDVFLEAAPSRRGRVHPTYLRGDLLITDVRGGTTPGYRAIVFAENEPISGFLGTAENPTHTRWEHRRHKDRFAPGANNCLKYVQRSVANLLSTLSQADREADVTIFAELFPRPAEEDDARRTAARRSKKRKAKNEPAEPEPRPDGIEHAPRRYQVYEIKGGFKITALPGSVPPDRITLKAAYHVRRGSPFSAYEKARKNGYADFDFAAAGVNGGKGGRGEPRIAIENAHLDSCDGNRVVIEPLGEEFSVEVTGFDGNRDLRLSHRGASDRPDPTTDGDAVETGSLRVEGEV